MKILIELISILSLLIISIASFAQKAHTLGEKGFTLDVEMHPDGKKAASTLKNDVLIWNLNSKTISQKLTNGHQSKVMTIDFDPTGNRLVSGSEGGKIIIWNLQSGQKKAVFNANAHVTSVKFHPTQNVIAAALANGKVMVWDANTEKLLHNINAHQEDATCLAFNPAGTLLASGGADKTIALWDVDSGEIVKRLQEHSNWVRSVAFNEDGRTLASAGDDGKLLLWSVSNLQNIRANIEHSLMGDWMLCANYATGFNTIVLGSRKGKIAVKTNFGSYEYKLGIPVNDVVLVPNASHKVIALAATHGNGLMLIDAEIMKMKK